MNLLQLKNLVSIKWINYLLVLLSILLSNTVSAEQTITYFHTDALGSVAATSDESGDLLWRKSYKPYGEKITDGEGKNNALAYTGKPHDESTGLTYMGARYYDPEVGRFMGVDPVGFQEDNPMMFNRYAYANNNPYKFVDPDGEFAILVAVSVAVAVFNIGNDMMKAYQSNTSIMESGFSPAGMKAAAVAGAISTLENAGPPGRSIINKGGRFADLDKAKGVGEVAHHMPQNAFNKINGVSRGNGPAIGMSIEDHAKTRTFAGRGKSTMRNDSGLNARQRLATDIKDLRSQFGRKYNKGSLGAIKYAKTKEQFKK